jgi:hypothetical protein
MGEVINIATGESAQYLGLTEGNLIDILAGEPVWVDHLEGRAAGDQFGVVLRGREFVFRVLERVPRPGGVDLMSVRVIGEYLGEGDEGEG